MYNLLYLLFLASTLSIVCANLHSSIPEDLYAFPKYRISFLNGLPVSNETAERWLRDGLKGGESEFLDQWPPNFLKAIESGDVPASSQQEDQEEERPFGPDQQSRQQTSEPSPVIEHMRLGPSKSYLCLIPPPPTLPPPPPDENQATVTPTHSWTLLQPLTGTCLYHRQAWFTYSYCHNLHVRQFRELPATYPHPPGARVVEEDPEWESYTLGKSPSAHGTDGDLTANDELALANNLELARQGAGQRYLVQRWSGGTPCDKTGRPREIEVQFHCSMTMTDTILFVKETRTCEYVLVVHTPRLCGEPGFKSRLAQMPESAVRCREVVQDVADVDPTLPEGPHPYKQRPRGAPVPTTPEKPAATEVEAEAEAERGRMGSVVDRAQETLRTMQRALEALMGRGEVGAEELAVLGLEQGEREGEFYLTLDPRGEGEGGQVLEEVLRAVGYKGQKGEEEGEERKEERVGDEEHGGYKKDEL